MTNAHSSSEWAHSQATPQRPPSYPLPTAVTPRPSAARLRVDLATDADLEQSGDHGDRPVGHAHHRCQRTVLGQRRREPRAGQSWDDHGRTSTHWSAPAGGHFNGLRWPSRYTVKDDDTTPKVTDATRSDADPRHACDSRHSRPVRRLRPAPGGEELELKLEALPRLEREPTPTE